jgi:hypothetical protein
MVLIKLIMNSEPSFQGAGWENVSKKGKDFIIRLLNKNPKVCLFLSCPHITLTQFHSYAQQLTNAFRILG